jgi:hypothetical protein
MEAMGESPVKGAMSSISTLSSLEVVRKFTLTFWRGSSNGPDTTRYPKRVERSSVVGSRDGTATPT